MAQMSLHVKWKLIRPFQWNLQKWGFLYKQEFAYLIQVWIAQMVANGLGTTEVVASNPRKCSLFSAEKFELTA